MGDTRPPLDRRLSEIESIRLWTAQVSAQPAETWGAVVAGEALSNTVRLLSALDAVMSAPDFRQLVYEALREK